MTFKDDCIKFWNELKPFVFFLLKDIILIILTMLAIKLIILSIEWIFGPADTVVSLFEVVSKIGLLIMFLLHTAVELTALIKKNMMDR